MLNYIHHVAAGMEESTAPQNWPSDTNSYTGVRIPFCKHTHPDCYAVTQGAICGSVMDGFLKPLKHIKSKRHNDMNHFTERCRQSSRSHWPLMLHESHRYFILTKQDSKWDTSVWIWPSDSASARKVVPFPVCIIQEGKWAVCHGVGRLTQQPVFVLKHTGEKKKIIIDHFKSNSSHPRTSLRHRDPPTLPDPTGYAAPPQSSGPIMRDPQDDASVVKADTTPSMEGPPMRKNWS